jgi:hypothetical protein
LMCWMCDTVTKLSVYLYSNRDYEGGAREGTMKEAREEGLKKRREGSPKKAREKDLKTS